MTGEEYLAVFASQFRAEDFRRIVAAWAARNDPIGLEEAYQAAEDREYVGLARTMGGWHLEGFLTERTGQLFKTALEAVHTPPAPGDDRTVAQRRAGDLAVLAETFLSKGLGGLGGGVRPHLAVTIDYDTLARLAAAHGPAGLDVAAMVGTKPAQWQDGSGPIPHSLLEQLACDSSLGRYVFGPTNELINLGRTKRLFSAAQRRALNETDRTCAFPGCTADASWCDGHHVRPFAQGGATDVVNGALACGYHHRLVHRLGLRLIRDRDHRWRCYRADGREYVTAGASRWR